MSIKDTLEDMKKAIGHKKAKGKALDQAKGTMRKQTYSAGYGHGIDEGKKKASINKRKSPLFISLKGK